MSDIINDTNNALAMFLSSYFSSQFIVGGWGPDWECKVSGNANGFLIYASVFDNGKVFVHVNNRTGGVERWYDLYHPTLFDDISCFISYHIAS